MDSMTQQFAAAIWLLIVIQKTKFWNELKRKLKNANQSHRQNFNTTAKSNIPIRSTEDRSTPSFYVIEII
jgi:hypothetical protein